MDNHEINTILDEHPQLREQITRLLRVVVNAQDDIERADDAERQIIESVRLIGHNALQGWAGQQSQKVSERTQKQKPNLRKHVKKNSSGTAPTEK